jgi:hypothetical protein
MAYIEKINQAVRRYDGDAGFRVLGISGLESPKALRAVSN